MSFIEKAIRNFALNGVLSRYVSSVPKNRPLKIFMDRNYLNILGKIAHTDVCAYVFIDKEKRCCDYFKVYVHNANFNGTNSSVRVNYVDSSENMKSYVRDFFENDADGYAIVMSDSEIIRKTFEEINAKNALLCNIEKYRNRFHRTHIMFSGADNFFHD